MKKSWDLPHSFSLKNAMEGFLESRKRLDLAAVLLEFYIASSYRFQ